MFESQKTVRPKVDELRGGKFQAIAGGFIVVLFFVQWIVEGHPPRSVAILFMGTMFVTAGCIRIRRTGTAPGLMGPLAILFGAAAAGAAGVLVYQLITR